MKYIWSVVTKYRGEKSDESYFLSPDDIAAAIEVSYHRWDVKPKVDISTETYIRWRVADGGVISAVRCEIDGPRCAIPTTTCVQIASLYE